MNTRLQSRPERRAAVSLVWSTGGNGPAGGVLHRGAARRGSDLEATGEDEEGYGQQYGML